MRKVIIKHSDLPKIRKLYADKKIVFCSGSFDLIHAGHILFFEDSKNLGDILVVSVGPDSDLRKTKGPDRPVLNEKVRLKTIASLKPVDFCLLGKPLPTKGHIHQPLEHIFKTLSPDIYAVNDDIHDADFRKKLADKHNVKTVLMERWCPPEFDQISTTRIINKIKGLELIKNSKQAGLEDGHV